MKHIFVFTFLFVFFSCQNKEVKIIEKQDYLSLDSFWNLDTLTHNDIYFPDTISEQEFYKTAGNTILDLEIIDDSKNIIRDDSVLILKLKNFKRIEFIDKKNPYIERYFYLRNIEVINSWLVEGLHGDEHAYLFLVNKNTGKKSPIAGEPIISPNKKYFMCSGTSCTDPSLIQFFKVENDSVRKVWIKLSYNWAVTEIKWKNDTLIYLKKENICSKIRTVTYQKLQVSKYMK